MHYIKYKEQDLPVTVDFAVIKTICAKLNLKLSQFEQIVDSPEQTEKLFFEGLKRGHKLEGKEMLIAEKDVEDILSASYADFLQIFNKSVLEMFTPSKKN